MMKRFAVPFLFVSGMPLEEWQRQAGKFVEDLPFLPKPVSENDLKQFWIKQVLCATEILDITGK